MLQKMTLLQYMVMQLTMVRYTDHDKNEIVDKGILVADGKVLDPNGFVIIKKGATV